MRPRNLRACTPVAPVTKSAGCGFDLPDNVLEVYREPVGDTFALERIVRPEDTITPLAFPDLVAKAGDFIP